MVGYVWLLFGDVFTSILPGTVIGSPTPPTLFSSSTIIFPTQLTLLCDRVILVGMSPQRLRCLSNGNLGENS